MTAVRAALIDLDGTLLDTAPDLAAAANRMLRALGRPPRPVEEIANYVGKGIARLVERSLTGDLEKSAGPELLQRALALFAPAYDEESGRSSRIYAGVEEGLKQLKAENLKLACVTNKAERFTLPLLERMNLLHYFDAVVCGDRVARPKPNPDCYVEACRRLGVQAQEAVIIGDSENDVQAARAAGIRVFCVTYGYREGKPVESLGADAVVSDLLHAAERIRCLSPI
jgi:phosphoglycolate phosphatase